MNAAELQEIRDEIWTEPWKDPQLFHDLLNHVVNLLGELAIDPSREGLYDPIRPYEVTEWATGVLRELEARAKSGVPFNEPVWGDQPPPPEDL